MIRVVVVDDHHAIRLGLRTALRAEPGFVPVASAADAGELAPLLARHEPDLVVLDYRLPDVDGLTVCREIKARVPAPGVILYSAFADGSMTIPAMLAGADGILDKGVPPDDLFAAMRAVFGGGRALPSVSADQLRAAGALLDEEDLPVLGMLVEGTPEGEVAATLRVDPLALRRRVARMLGRLAVSVAPQHRKAPR